MRAPRLVTVVLEVADLDRSEALYREAFGLDLHRSLHDGDDPWIGGAHAALSWTEGAFIHFALYESRGGGRTTGAQIAFAVEDIEAAHARAVGAGADVLHAPRDEPWGRSARYRDPDGNVVELTQRG
jgi:predicted enzyme related to lactoylglutathione lyase